ncbi:hypothetical protein ACTJJ0_30860 [Chitinophaga sp. 22321]|uniref:Uncharacterized protein n=1 Tax=Chitinophaga hostae TaxID=2831022 RepID=A0ABS5JAY6_9BACT|nr:hypothetical protein [Chitinophaga hostae]MBS0031602.1 hypothetical protein [Chitinophaga hostae]
MTDTLNIIPEVVILDSLTKGLAYIRDNFHANAEADTYLFKLLNGMQIGSYNFYEQAKLLFVNNEDNPRRLALDFEFKFGEIKAPSIVVPATTEMPTAGGEWLSMGQGFLYPQDFGMQGPLPTIYTRRKKAMVTLGILTDDGNELLMLYHLLSGVLLSMQLHLSLKGLEQLTVGAEESKYFKEKSSLLNKALLLSFEYNFSSVAVPADNE